MTEEIAARDWHTRALVRILKTTTCHSVAPWTQRTYEVDEELEMVQWGRAGYPVEREAWWSEFDIDAAHIIEASSVEVVKVLDEVSPQEEVFTESDGENANHSDSSESVWWNPEG